MRASATPRRHICRTAFLHLAFAMFAHAHAQLTIPSPALGCLLPAGTELLEVFDVTPPHAGQVYYAPVGTTVNLYLEPSTEEWVRTALGANCSVTDSSQKIAVRLMRVSIAESASGTSARTAAFVGMEVLHRSDAQWRIIHVVEGIVQERGSVEDDGRHARMLTAAIDTCMRSYARARAEGRLIDRPYVPGSRAMSSADHPIFHVPTLPPGVFKDVEAFRQGWIMPMADTLLAVGSGRVRLKGELREAKESVWGLSDGDRYYVRWEGKFVALKTEGNGFSAVLTRTELTPAMAYMFGAVGGMLTMRTERIPVQLDLASGMLVPENNASYDAGCLHTVHLSRFAAEGTNVMVGYGDHTIALTADTYCVLHFPSASGSELVRVQGPNGYLELALPINGNTDSFHLIDLSADGVPVEKNVTTQMEAQLRKRLKTTMRRPPEAGNW